MPAPLAVLVTLAKKAAPSTTPVVLSVPVMEGPRTEVDDPVVEPPVIVIGAAFAAVSVQVCGPVQVGAIACESGGAESLVMKVEAEPLTADSPIVAEGLALETLLGADHVVSQAGL